MSKFEKADSGKDVVRVPEAWTETRCHVCTSKYRQAIDRMLAMGTGFSEISRVFGGEIDRRSIARHAEKHLRYEEAAIRNIIKEQTEIANENAELGISGETKRRVYLETALHKALEQLVGDDITIETKDGAAIIEALNKLDQRTTGAQLDEIKVQFQAFLQAIREVSSRRGDPTLGSDILIRARQIAGQPPPQLDKGK